MITSIHCFIFIFAIIIIIHMRIILNVSLKCQINHESQSAVNEKLIRGKIDKTRNSPHIIILYILEINIHVSRYLVINALK